MLKNGAVYSMEEKEYNVIVPHRVKSDIHQIKAYKERFGTYESNINKLMAEIYEAIASLETSPNIGVDLSARVGFKTHFRYMVIREYLMFYYIDGMNVKVVRILSAKSNWRRTLFR